MKPTPPQLPAYTRCVAGMLADPHLVGDLLLIGLYWARAVHLGDPPLEGLGRSTAAAVYSNAEHGFWLPKWRRQDTSQRVDRAGTKRVWGVIRSDIRRYVPDTSKGGRCQRPIRRSAEEIERRGEICGRSSDWPTFRHLLTDPVDGTRHTIGACSRPRCRAWWEALRARNDAELVEHGAPEPVANAGGVLAGHLDEIDWERIYLALDSNWVPPHEAAPWHRPALTVVVDQEHADEPVAALRPDLTVVKGGWR
ncbi:MAG: hypothetical protein PHQ28_03405 [Mycobacterium sp.]|nr:hypothetical protein [Mycobacterium sp.]